MSNMTLRPGMSNMTNGAGVGVLKQTQATKKRRAFYDVTNSSTNLEGGAVLHKKPRLLSNTKKRVPRKALRPIASGNRAVLPRNPTMIPKETYVPSKKKNDYTIKPVQVPLKKPDDIDKRDRKNVLAVTDYVEDMYALFRQQESKVCPSFMDRQPVNNPKKMRGILIDWIIGIHHKNFRLCPETLYLTVHMLDRFLAGNQVPLNKLQLVGVTALLIASKYEDIYPPAVQDLSYITGNAVNPEEILDMETTILKDLDYRISKPTAHTFLVRYTRAGHANVELAQSASYILEGTLLQADLVSAYLPSELAAASVYIARRSITGREPWTSTLVKYTGYTEDQVIPIAKKCISIENKFHEVDHKYRRSCYGKVAVKSYGF